MGRECRRVPAGWKHPTKLVYGSGGPVFRATPLYEGRYRKNAVDCFIKVLDKYGYSAMGLERAIECEGLHGIDPNNYMPDWTPEEATHYQMYENTSEGTPISPPMATKEELARWLVDNKASVFGDMTATYEQWMNVIDGSAGFGIMISKDGVEPI